MPESTRSPLPVNANGTGPAIEPLVSPEAFAAFLSIGRRTFQTWRAVGKLPPPDLALGKTIRWRRATIDAWLEARQRLIRR